MTFVLDAITRALKITIDAGAGADVQFVATYADSTSTTFTKGSSQGASNGATAVNVVAAPAASTRRVVKAISFYNANATDPRTVTFYYDDNGTAYTIAKFTLQAGQSWYSETASTEEKGATILDATNRAIKFSIDVAGSDVQYTAAWADSTDTAFTQGSSRGLSNGTSAVTIVGAPAASTRRLVQSITFYNAHASSTRVVTLFYDDNGTTRTIAKFSLVAGDSWFSEVATFGIQPQGYVYAAPAVGSGLPSFRALGLSDVVSGSTGSGDVVLQTSPTIITPRIATIHTASSPFRAVVSFVQATNSANYLQITNAATGSGTYNYLGPIIEAIGTGTNIGIEIKSKGLGAVNVTASGMQVIPHISTNPGALSIRGGTGSFAGGQLILGSTSAYSTAFVAPDGMVADVYYTLPGADGSNGQVLSTNGSGVLSWVTASGGGVTDGDKGDITVSGSGATWTIDNGVVTLAKMADLVTDRLIGRDSSGTGAPEALTVGGGIEFTGSGGIQTSAFTGDVTKTAGGNALTIANDAVTFAKMQNVTSGVLLGRTTASTGDIEQITPGTGILTLLQTPTSANLAAAVSDETGSGSLVFGTSPTLTMPRIAAIHTASSPNNAALAFAQVASSVNYLQITNAASAGYPILEAIGTDANIGMVLKAKGTGYLQIDADRVETFGGDLFIYDNRSVAFFETSNVDFISIAAPSSLSTSTAYILPTTAGSSGQFLTTNGAGTLSWSNQTTTLSGDVTGSGTTAITTTIANNVVTFSKFTQIDTDTLVGRDTASTGNAEMITVTGGIEFSGSGSIRTTAFTGDVTKTAGGTALTIANDAVTYAKMQNMAADRVLGRRSTTGDPEELTLTQTLDLVGSAAQGDILYRGASTWTRLGAGTRGRYLQTGGASANPSWAQAATFKNLVINGDMRVDQRRNGGSATINTATNTYTVDRWLAVGQSSDGIFTVQRSTTAPTAFANTILATVSTADTTANLGATQFYGISQYIEGFNAAQLLWGTANALTVTLSFWVRASITGTFGGAIRNGAANRSYPFTYTIDSANTFEYKTITIAGDTSGTWATNNTSGPQIWFSLAAGASRSGTAGAWNGNNNVSATGAVNFMDQNSRTFYLTGVQLEVGSVATEYEYLPIEEQLAQCQRYCATLRGQGWRKFAACSSDLSSTLYGTYYCLPVEMRIAPSMSFSALGDFKLFRFNDASQGDPTAIAVNSNSTTTISLTVTTGSGSSGAVCFLYGLNSNALLTFDAEL